MKREREGNGVPPSSRSEAIASPTVEMAERAEYKGIDAQGNQAAAPIGVSVLPAA